MTQVSEPELLAIGQVADATGASISALRYYDEIGLIEPTTRVGGKRRFSPDVVGRIRFTQRSQEAGFSLEEIKAILDDTVGQWHQLIDDKLAELIERRANLDETIAMLSEIRQCGCQVVADCELSPPRQCRPC